MPAVILVFPPEGCKFLGSFCLTWALREISAARGQLPANKTRVLTVGVQGAAGHKVIKHPKKCGWGSTASACSILCQFLPGNKPQPQLATLCSSFTKLPWHGGELSFSLYWTWAFPFLYIYIYRTGWWVPQFYVLEAEKCVPFSVFYHGVDLRLVWITQTDKQKMISFTVCKSDDMDGEKK